MTKSSAAISVGQALRLVLPASRDEDVGDTFGGDGFRAWLVGLSWCACRWLCSWCRFYSVVTSVTAVRVEDSSTMDLLVA